MGIKVSGIKEAKRGFERLRKEMPKQIDSGVKKHTEDVFNETQARVPRETNALAETGRMEKDSTPSTLSSHRIIYGDDDGGPVDYAAAVHEILDAKHAAPTGAKYVEQPLIESIPEAEKTMSSSAKKAVKEAFK